MTEPLPHPGWIARTFTRARVMATHLARIPLGDKSFELPFVFSRVQLAAVLTGAVAALVAFGVGSLFGIAAWTTWPVLILTLAATVALGFSSAPDRGVAIALEGYARMVWVALPFTSSITSSRRRSARPRPERITVAMRLHPPVVPAGGHHAKRGS
ncbi:hypothetical protein C1Y40_00614 [Mycobacterium talmoniae]|uniref:Uncharacterized protein n=1 Tax=Mycobacterium talmoniae TaxID=1858794 RepID=A0A2S8BR62_9MYCO|nr:hypothetical protein C1Y40_00614 [Mycobacterium talmoniae]